MANMAAVVKKVFAPLSVGGSSALPVVYTDQKA